MGYWRPIEHFTLREHEMIMKKDQIKLKRTVFNGISTVIITPYLALMGELPANAETIELILTNGDIVHGTLIKSESNNDVTVIIHPSLGRLEIQKSALKPKTQAKRWTASISGGVTGSNSDEDLDYGGTAQISTRYKDNINLFSFKANSAYEVSRDSGKATTSTDTNQGQADLRYSRKITEKLDVYAGSHYDYNTLNSIGANNLVNSIGLGYDLLKAKTSTLNISLGPSSQTIWGGSDCANNSICGKTYAASTIGFQYDWKPNNFLKILASNFFTTAYSDKLSPSNSFSAQIKIYPMRDQKLYTSFNGRINYNALTTPRVDNSFSFMIGAELF